MSLPEGVSDPIAPRRRGGRRRWLLILLAVALVAGGISAAALRSGGGKDKRLLGALLRAASGALAWQDCGDGLQCAQMIVPLDYYQQGGTNIGVVVAVLPARDPARRIGALFVDPGGPGLSGIGFLRSSEGSLDGLRDRFDLITFDPRGSRGPSAIVCGDPSVVDALYALDPTPDDAAEYQALRDGYHRFADACDEKSGGSLPFMGSIFEAADMETLRMLLGEQQLSYLGFSYGSVLGLTYAAFYPDRVRAMVLDAPLDPNVPSLQAVEQQAVAREDALSRLFDDCTRYPSCPLGADDEPPTAFDRLIRRLDREPRQVGARTLGSLDVLAAVNGLLASPTRWPELQGAIGDAENGGGVALLRIADEALGRDASGRFAGSGGLLYAVNCTDRYFSTSPSVFQAAADEAAVSSPHFGAYLVYQSLACMYWPVPATRLPLLSDAAKAPDPLVVGTTHDPRTPYDWATSVTDLVNGVLLTFEGDGHGAYDRSACVRGYVNAYLTSLQLPVAGTTCT